MITILDGGMGQELLARARSEPTAMWSARVMLDEPELVTQIHREFIDAGAQVITINAYAATPERLKIHGRPELFEPLQMAAIAAAKQARGTRDVKITGCLPPLFNSYNPDLNKDYDFACEIYRRIADIQQDHVDIFLAETLGSLLEVRACLTALAGRDKPIWISVSLADGTDAQLRSGEPLAEAIALIKDAGADACLLNCSTPETISAAMPLLTQCGLDFGAYANGFSGVVALGDGDVVADLMTSRSDLTPEAYADFALAWAKQGASLIGGCCEVGPAHIAKLTEYLRAEVFEIYTTFDGGTG